jgi:hypothetical protein
MLAGWLTRIPTKPIPPWTAARQSLRMWLTRGKFGTGLARSPLGFCGGRSYFVSHVLLLVM